MIYWLNTTGNSLPKDIKKILSKGDQCNLFITSVEIESYLESMAIELNLYGQDKDYCKWKIKNNKVITLQAGCKK